MKNLDVEMVLRLLGIRAKRRGHKWMAKCPNPDHPDTHPSWTIIDKPISENHGSHYCFSCKFGGGPWELAAAVWRCDVDEAGKKLKELGLGRSVTQVNVPKVEIKDNNLKSRFPSLPKGVVIPGSKGKWYGPALQYLKDRGVTDLQIDKWNIGYALRGRFKNRIVFPVYNKDGNLVTASARSISKSIDPRYDQIPESAGARPEIALWGIHKAECHTGVTVAEGVFSALALERAGAPSPIATLRSDLTRDQLRLLSRARLILAAPDPDDAGEYMARQLTTLARYAEVIRVPLQNSPDDERVERLSEIISRIVENRYTSS